MTANKNEILWKLDRSTGVKVLQTAREILGIVHVCNIIPSRTGSFTWSIKTPDEITAFGSGTTVLDAIEEAEEAFQEYLEKFPTLGDRVPTAPVNPIPAALDGVPAPKEEKMRPTYRQYDPSRPIREQLVRSNTNRKYFIHNDRIQVGSYFLSIQCSETHYCSPRLNLDNPADYETYEIAIMDKDGDFCGKRIFPDKFEYDDVLGYVRPEDIQQIADEIIHLPADYIHPDTKLPKEDDEEVIQRRPQSPDGKTEMLFYTYDQNNSGGSFHDPAEYVIIEASSADDANRRAEEKGLYFDGAGDCSCCGNRWSAQYGDNDGTKQPEIYGKPVSEATSYREKNVVIFYADGREERVALKLED